MRRTCAGDAGDRHIEDRLGKQAAKLYLSSGSGHCLKFPWGSQPGSPLWGSTTSSCLVLGASFRSLRRWRVPRAMLSRKLRICRQLWILAGSRLAEEKAALSRSANGLAFVSSQESGGASSSSRAPKQPSKQRSSASFSKSPVLLKKSPLTGSRYSAADKAQRVCRTRSRVWLGDTAPHVCSGGSWRDPSRSERRDSSPLNPLETLKAARPLGVSRIRSRDWNQWDKSVWGPGSRSLTLNSSPALPEHSWCSSRIHARGIASYPGAILKYWKVSTVPLYFSFGLPLSLPLDWSDMKSGLLTAVDCGTYLINTC